MGHYRLQEVISAISMATAKKPLYTSGKNTAFTVNHDTETTWQEHMVSAVSFMNSPLLSLKLFHQNQLFVKLWLFYYLLLFIFIFILLFLLFIIFVKGNRQERQLKGFHSLIYLIKCLYYFNITHLTQAAWHVP